MSEKIRAAIVALIHDRGLRLIAGATCFLLLAGLTLVGWFAQPDWYAHGYVARQPLPFPHRLHAGRMQISCFYCHTGPRVSRHSGIPPLETCMNCHRVTRTDTAPIRQLAAAYREDRPIQWKRVYWLPQHVFFDHRPHVTSGIACQSCHGQVQDMLAVRQEMSMRMGHCVGCHRAPGGALPQSSPIKRGPEYCNACHR